MTEDEKNNVIFPTLIEELESEENPKHRLSDGEKEVLTEDFGATNALGKAQLTVAIYVVKKFQKMTDEMIASNDKSANKMFWLTVFMAILTAGLVFVGVVQIFWGC
jgi:hypothetical protein